MSECRTCGDAFTPMLGESNCIDCIKEKRGVETIRSLQAEIARLRAGLEGLKFSAPQIGAVFYDVDCVAFNARINAILEGGE